MQSNNPSKKTNSIYDVFLNIDWKKYIVYIAFVVIFIIFSITLSNQGFLSSSNLLNIVRQTAIIAIMAVAMTFVISTGEIDLSVGSITALSSLTAALAIQAGGVTFGIIAGLATGAVIGILNGILVTRFAIPSFLVTLGMMQVVKGGAMWTTDTDPVTIIDPSFNFWFGSGDLGVVPVLLIWLLVIWGIAHIVYRKTKFGRQTLATGGNPTSAKFSGINTSKIKLTVFTFSGMMAGLAGMLYAGRLHTGRYSFGDGDELSVIAAVILGGTNLFGGKGSVAGSVMGALMIGMIKNGLIIMGLDSSQQQIVQGAIIILAVAFGRKE